MTAHVINDDIMCTFKFLAGGDSGWLGEGEIPMAIPPVRTSVHAITYVYTYLRMYILCVHINYVYEELFRPDY